MIIKINGKEVDIDIPDKVGVMQASMPITQPICQPICRDTSPNALRAEQIKEDFNKAVFADNFKI